jgi:pyridoxine kinase
MSNKIKKVAAIHDLSGFGRCALTVVIPVISAMGIQVVPLPSAVMSTHTGGFTDIVINPMTETMAGISEHWKKLGLTFDAVYTGFLADAAQCGIVDDFISHFGGINTLTLVDPVFGDDGELYSSCTTEHIKGMRKLCSKADMITPNLTEACMLTELPYPDGGIIGIDNDFSAKLIKALFKTGAKKIAVTGINTETAEGCFVATLIADDENSKPLIITEKRAAASYPGTGELFASVLLGKMLGGYDFASSAKYASDFTRAAVVLSMTYAAPPREGLAVEAMLRQLK